MATKLGGSKQKKMTTRIDFYAYGGYEHVADLLLHVVYIYD